MAIAESFLIIFLFLPISSMQQIHYRKVILNSFLIKGWLTPRVAFDT